LRRGATQQETTIAPRRTFTTRAPNQKNRERADGGKLTDAEFLKSLPKKYIRAKLELNKAKIKADGLDGDALAELGLVRVATMSMKLKAKSSQAA